VTDEFTDAFDAAVAGAAERFSSEGEPFLRDFGEYWFARIQAAREAGSLSATEARACSDRLRSLARSLPGEWSEHTVTHRLQGSIDIGAEPEGE
jgi:hypothetical protein